MDYGLKMPCLGFSRYNHDALNVPPISMTQVRILPIASIIIKDIKPT